MAQTQADLAARIEALSVDTNPEAPNKGLGWVLYPPATFDRCEMSLDGCILNLLSLSQSGTPMLQTSVDLRVATIFASPQGQSYDWFENTNGSATGVISFEAAPNQLFPSDARIQPTNPFVVRSTTPTDWEMEREMISRTSYILWFNPPRETVAALGTALLDYQRQYCRPRS